MEVLQLASTIASSITSIGALIVMVYTFSKFMNKPHDTLEQRISVIEVRMGDVDRELNKGDEKFKEVDQMGEVLITSVLALVQFEIQYCIEEKKPMSEELKEAKKNLTNYLSKK
jgi:hypothetical protein